MSMSQANRTWVGDQLYEVVGLSERHVVDFLLAAAKKAKTVGALLSQFRICDLPDGPRTERFAQELWDRLPRQKSAAEVSARR